MLLARTRVAACCSATRVHAIAWRDVLCAAAVARPCRGGVGILYTGASGSAVTSR